MKAIKKPQVYQYAAAGGGFQTKDFDGVTKNWTTAQFENRFELDKSYENVVRDKRVAVEAIQIPVAFTVADPGGGTLTGNANDWLIIRDSGDLKVLADVQFRNRYDLI